MAKKPTKTRAIDGVLHQVHPDNIVPWPDLNPRRHFDQDAMDELAESIRQRGNLQPVVVAPAPDFADAEYDDQDVVFWLAAGERRWRAAKQAKANLLCLVRDLTWEEAVDLAVVENLDRANLTALEEAEGLQKLVEIHGSQKAVAERLSRSQPWVSNRIRLLELPEEIRALIDDGVIEVSTARDVLLPFNRLKETARTLFFSKVEARYRELEKQMDGPASLGAVHRVVTDIAREMSRPLDPKAWRDAPKFDPSLHEDCGCNGPQFDYSQYGGSEKSRRCFDTEWWDARQAEAEEKEAKRVERAAKKAKKKAETIGDAAVLPMDEVRNLYGFRVERIGTRKGFSPGVLVDPTRFPDESLILADDHGELTLICTDKGKVRAAKGQITREKNPLIEERRAQRLREDLEAVESMDLEPWMVAHVIHHSSGYTYRRLETVAEELEIEVNHYDAPVTDLAEEDLLRWVKLLAYRSKRGDYEDHRDAVEVEIEAELRAKYEPLLKEMIPDPETAEAAA